MSSVKPLTLPVPSTCGLCEQDTKCEWEDPELPNKWLCKRCVEFVQLADILLYKYGTGMTRPKPPYRA